MNTFFQKRWTHLAATESNEALRFLPAPPPPEEEELKDWRNIFSRGRRGLFGGELKERNLLYRFSTEIDIFYSRGN
jgi:hypothetical protein